MQVLLKELKYSLYVTVRPFKGFWDLKHEGEGSFRTAMVILAILMMVMSFSPFFTEWLFNPYDDPLHHNVFTALIGYMALYLAWCISNWCFTCLSEGEGTLKEICTVSAYALVPFLIVQVLQIILSHVFVLGEQALFNLIGSVGMIWSGMLLLFGILVVHQYTLLKTMVVCFVTLVGMLVMGYIAILLLNLVAEMTMFFSVLVDEVRQFRA